MKYSPDKQLDRIRELLEGYPDETTGDIIVEDSELATLIHELDNWLCGGGPFPKEWTQLR